MADILIRIEKPKYCFLCRFFREVQDYDGTFDCCMAAKKEINPECDDCFFPSLPEGHGNLIDGHKLYRALFATECGNIAADRDSEGWPKVLTYEAVKKAIQDATIIVPAEGGEADGNS